MEDIDGVGVVADSGLGPWRALRAIADNSLDVVFEATTEATITWSSASVADVLGWSTDEVIGRSAADLVHPDDLLEVIALAGELNRGVPAVQARRVRLRTKAGGWRSLALRGRPVLDDDVNVVGHIVTFRDSTELDDALRALTTLSEANRVVVHATDEHALMTRICEAIQRAGPYPLVWIAGRRTDPDRSLTVEAASGPGTGYVDGLPLTWADTPDGLGAPGTAVRTGVTQVRRSLRESASPDAWRDRAERHGLASIIALPIVVDGEVVAALNVYAHEEDAFDQAGRTLLEDLAADLGRGIERLRSAAMAEEERARLAGMMRSLLEPVVLLEPIRNDEGQIVDLVYVEASDAAMAFNRLTREQMVGARISELFPGQVADGSLGAYAHTIETGEPILMDDVLYFHEVRQEALRMDIRAARCGSGIAIAFRDVTERYEAAERLRRSEERYRLLADHASDGVFLADDAFNVEWASPSSSALLGVAPEVLQGTNAVGFIHPDDLPHIAEAIGSRSDRRVRVRYRWLMPDGTYAWRETNANPVTTDGDRTRYVISIRDVDAQVRAELALQEREEHYRMLAENASDVVLLGDEAFIIAWCSSSVEQALGYRPEELVGASARAIIHPDDLAAIDAAVGAGVGPESMRLRYRVRLKDGTYRWFDTTGRPTPRADGSLSVIISLRDVDAEVQAQTALAEREQRYRLLAENSTDVVLIGDRAFNITWASVAAEATLGVSADDLAGTNAARFIHPDDVPGLREKLGAGGEGVPKVRYRWLQPDGSAKWVEAHGSRLPDPQRDDLLIVSIRDVDAEVAAETALREREERFRLLAENASDVVWQVAPDGVIEWASPSVAGVLGHQPADLVGRSVLEFMYPDDIADGSPSRDAAMTGKATSGEMRLLTAEGTPRWMAYTIRPVPRANGLARIATFRDIEQEYLTRRDLEFARGHDSLTGLPTRQAVTAILDRDLAEVVQDRFVAVLCVGVDGLTQVNDALTHYAGDLLISTIAARLTAVVGSAGSVARGTGDEFLVVLGGLVDPGDAGVLADRILDAMREPVRALRELLLPTVSIGIATSSAGSTSGRLLADAAVALRQSKDAGRDRYTFLDQDLAARLQGRLALERRIRDALAAREFHAWLQPIVSLGDGKVCGYEALARWAGHGEPLLPGDFIPTAERSTLISELDLAILEEALSHLLGLPANLFVSVNVSATSLISPDYRARATDLLLAYGVDGTRLHLEVTETTILEIDEAVRESMNRFADMGVRWYVDDFGTGYSSISHLRSLPITGLKLDLSFTRGIREGDLTSVHLAKGLFGLAEGLGLHTIAEGVETDVEAMVLASQGWQGGQGWLYGRPAPFEAPSPPA